MKRCSNCLHALSNSSIASSASAGPTTCPQMRTARPLWLPSWTSIDASCPASSTARPPMKRPSAPMAPYAVKCCRHRAPVKPAHIYDRARLWPTSERTLIRRCRRPERLQPAWSAWLTIAGARHNAAIPSAMIHACSIWPDGHNTLAAGANAKPRIVRSPAAPDLYEISSPKEFVGGRIWSTSSSTPSYACRRPALYRYYQAHFGWAPPTRLLPGAGLPQCRQ